MSGTSASPRVERLFESTARLIDRLRLRRRSVAVALYACVAVLAYFAGFLVRFEFRPRTEYLRLFLLTAPLLVAIRVGCSIAFKLITRRWRFASTADVVRLGAATTVGSAIFFALTRVLPLEPAVPRSIILIEWVLTAYLTAALWLAYRTGFEQWRHYRSGYNGSAKRVLIVGAGEAGSLLAREMHRSPTGYRAIGFIDDDPTKWGTSVHGVEVIGATRDLASIAAEIRAEEVVLAIPSALPKDLRQLVEYCENTDLPFKVLPGIAQVLTGDVRLSQLRDLRIEDLLGREPVELELPELAEDLRDRTVLITGAAGSIGSELARQVALHEPGALLLLDQSETDLFFLERELLERHKGVRVVPLIGDVVDPASVERAFKTWQPERVFHAAAYKHVPMMESNVSEAFRNNVVGTWRVADAAGRHGTGKFVLVSTDKAARPANVMGATKRLAEMLVLELQKQYPATDFCAVRFGNVLGSNGSVVPIFQRQLRAGKPLTVTHPDVTRYFMTIPEAVQLILQASLLSDVRGHVAMLDMGEAVRILELARNLLRLAGLPGNNGRIVFTGLRAGEKLHEELLGEDERGVPTAIEKVKIVRGPAPTPVSVVSLISRLVSDVAPDRAAEAVRELLSLFPGVLERVTDTVGPLHAVTLLAAARQIRN